MTSKRLLIGAALFVASATAFAQAPFPAVTNTNDSGAGSLRQAILDVNASCISAPANLTVSFAIPGTGPFRIRPLTPLPQITCPTTIDGYTQTGSAQNGNTGDGTNAVIQIELDGSLCVPCIAPALDVQANGVTISGLAIHSFAGPGISFTTPQIIFGILTVNGNFIGTDARGSSSPGNAGAGIEVVSGQLSAGDLLPANRNLITANNGPGIDVQSGASFSVINNLIGGRRDGTGGAGNNGAGIATASVFSNNTVAANYIRFNAGSGVSITGAAPNISGPPPANPSIFNNGGPGIDYPAGAPISPPTITSFVYDPASNTTTIDAAAPASSPLFPNIVDFYHNAAMPPFGEGQLFVARGNVDANGLVSVTVPGRATFVTATFTSCGDGCFGTSPFSLADFPPTLAITFAPNPLNFGSTGSMSMVLQNPNKTRTLGLVGFSFGLPAGLQIGAETAGADCAAGFSLAGASATTAAASNVTLAPGTTCTISAPLTATSGGTFNFAAGSIAVDSDAGPGTNGAASLLVTTGAVQFTPSSLTFARLNVGATSPPQTVTLTNTGNGALTITSIAIAGDFGFTGCGFPLTLAPNASCTLSVTFSPQVNGTATGSITVTSNAPGSPSVLPLSGTGANGPTPGIAVRPFGLGFGTIRVGSTASDRVTIVSNGSAPLTISGIGISGTFFSQSNSCPASLAVGASCDVTVTYAPTVVGSHTGQLVIQSNGDPPSLGVSLSGAAAALLPPTLSVASPVDFGQQIVGSTTRHALDLRNTGELSLLVSGLTVSGTAFRLEGSCGSIPPGGTCSVVVVFEPGSVIGTFTGSLAIASNDPRGTVTVDLLGQSLAAPRAEIDLSPDGIGFANQMIVTASATQTIRVTSVGTAPLHITGASITGSFFIASNGCGGTLDPGAQCQLAVGFLPLVPGLAQGRLTVSSDAAAGRSFASLTGTGCRFYSIAGMRNLLRLCSP